jgi:adenylyl-sulfate kinase
LLEDEDPDRLSEMLLSCLDMERGTVLAPITEYYYKSRPLFITTIPRSGTHMLLGLLQAWGIEQNFSSTPAEGKWNTLNDYSYHAPCLDFFKNEWFDPLGTHPFFRYPGIFMYRNPLDIIVSELKWFEKDINAFSHYLNTLKHQDEKLLSIIDDKYVFGSIRDRMLRYIGWLNFSNIIPVSYEELVGSRGGGDDDEQKRTIWSIQLKLHIPGAPSEIGKKFYSENSPTFWKGKIGSHREVFKDQHYRSFKSLNQDFMEDMGYEIGTTSIPRHVGIFRSRPLKFFHPSDEELWSQRLVEESYYGYNIVKVSGGFAAISQENGYLDLSNSLDRNKEGVYLGFKSLEEAMNFILVREIISEERVPRLADSYKKYNIVRMKGRYYGVPQSLGPLDLQSANLSSFPQILSGQTIVSVKKGIDKLAILKGNVDLQIQKPFILWLTGLPCSGKTTLAQSLKKEFSLNNSIPLTCLDGDDVRHNISKDLGFLKEDRHTNNLRVAEKALEILEKGDPVCVSSISPYRSIRHEIRKKIDNFVEVYVKCPLGVCEERDTKGMYKLARKGRVKNFTGVDDPYEEPLNPEITVETDKQKIEDSVDTIINELEKLGYIRILKKPVIKEEPVQYFTNTIGVNEIGTSPPILVEESFKGFNIVLFGSKYYAIAQSLGPLDLTCVEEAKLKEFQENGKCITGDSVIEAKYLVDQLFYQSLEKGLVEKNERVGTLQREVSDRDLRIEGLQSEVNDRDTRIADFQRSVSEKEAEIHSLKSEILDRDSKIESLQKDILEKAENIRKLNADISESFVRIELLQADITVRERTIESLKPELNLIKSKWWFRLFKGVKRSDN